MAGDAVAVVRGAYESFAQGDVGSVLSVLDPNVEWVESDAAGIPGRGTHVGPNAVAENVFGPVPLLWESFRLEPEDYFNDGDTVIVRGVVRGVTRASGRTLEAPFVHVFTVVDGRVTRMTNHHDTALWVEALRA